MQSFLAGLAMAALGGVALAAGGPPLVGEWRIEQIRGADAFDAMKTLFAVAPDGRLSTTVGCNRMAGKPTIEAIG